MTIGENNGNVAVKVKTVEAKKTQQIVSPKTQDAPITGAKVVDFVGDVKAELKKINWTNPEELKVYTKVVVGATFFLGMGLYFVDLFIQSFLSGLSFLIRWIA
jgi:preprotein translocase subunit SecE